MDNKKVGVFFLIGFLILMCAYFVWSGIPTSSVAVSSSAHGATGTWMKGGESIVLNFTLTMDSDNVTITSVNITFPGGVNGTGYNISAAELAKNSSNNGTLGSTWIFETNISSEICSLNWSGGNWNYTNATTMSFWINVTPGDFNNETFDTAWAIGYSIATGVSYTTYVNTSIDGAGPSFKWINISDGNTTLENSTTQPAIRVLNDTVYTEVWLRANSDWTVMVTVNDSNFGDAPYLLYFNNNTNVTSDALLYNGQIANFSGVSSNYIKMSSSGTGNQRTYNATIPASATNTNFTSFMFWVNDTLNNYRFGNNSLSTAYNVIATTNLTTIGLINATADDNSGYTNIITDGNVRNGTINFLRSGNITINVDIYGWLNRTITAGTNLSASSKVYLFYNFSHPIQDNVTTCLFNNSDTMVVMSNMTTLFTNAGQNITYPHRFNATFPQASSGFNDSTTVHFLVFANDSLGYSTYTKFNITIDDTAPTATTTLSPTAITNGNSVTITCSATDIDPTITSYNIYYRVQGGTYSSTGGTTYTYTPPSVGTYEFYCDAKDTTGHTGESTVQTLTVSQSTTTSTSGTSSGTSTTPTVTETTEIASGETENLGTLTQTIANNIVVGVDSVATFSMTTTSNTASLSSHSLTVSEITDTSVTVIIESDPIEITLEVGDTETVDVDGDGESDLEITLNSITNGEADLTINTLVEVPPELLPTEPTVTPPEPEAKGATGWWIVLIIVVIGLIVWFLFRKKKK